MARGWRDVVRRAGAPSSERATAPVPTANETATILSLPTVLLLFYFLCQPVFDAWHRFGYVRAPVARRAPATRLAPEPLVAHADAWHELTRVSHALIHQPSGTHAHVLGNVVLVTVLAWALLMLLTALGRRSLFALAYWELVVVAPLVGSFAFDLFGETAHGYGASTIGFAFLGVVAAASSVALVGSHADSHGVATRSTPCPDGGWTLSPVLAGGVLVSVLVVIFSDLAAASPATPVHQAGVVFGVLLGVVVVRFGEQLRTIVAT